jgi:transposase
MFVVSGGSMIGKQDRWQEDLFVIGTLRDLIPEDHLLRRIDRVVDFSWLRGMVEDCYDEGQGRPGIDPEAALRLMLAGLCQGIVHDRRLMREAQVNLVIRWFAGYRLHESLPDHSSLTRIRQRWGAERFKQIFQHTIRMCIDAGLISGELIHVDATLVRADVSWDSIVLQHIEKTWNENQDSEAKSTTLEKRSTTDPEATLATSCRHQKAEPCYKQHSAVDDRAGVVVSVITTTGAVNESSVLLEQAEDMQANLNRTPTCMTADAGYAYAKIYRGLEERGIDPVIPAKAELPPGPRMPMARFKYDAKHQLVRCPRGQKLRRSTRDQDRWYYRTGFHQCRECPLRQRCLSPKVDRRTIVISDGYDALLRARRRKNRGDEEFRQNYARHRWRSEGLNAELKNRHGLHRATRRGLENMKIQSYMTASAVNLKRLAR